MADTKTIITRIKNKVDFLSAWQSSAANKVDSNTRLLDGEIAIIRVPTGESYLNPVTGKSEPVVELLMKVGDGTSTFDALPWMSAKASDVYNWAKKATPDWNDFPGIPGDKLGLTVTVTGDGNAITDASYDAVTKTITLTKGETFTTKEEFDEHTHNISASGDDAITATGGELSVDIKHKEELGTTYTTAASTGASTFGSSATINIPSLSVNKYGHVIAIEDKPVTIAIPTPEEVTLPTVPDTYIEGQLVTEVDQANGAISVSRKSVDVTYDSTARTIQLTIDGTKVGTGFDASDFIKDGMIKSVDLVDKDDANNSGKFLKIVWNTPALDDDDVTTYVDLTTLIDVYTQGKGIVITGKQIAHQDKPTSGSAATVTSNKTGITQTFVRDVNVDEFGHVASIEAADLVAGDGVSLDYTRETNGKLTYKVSAELGNGLRFVEDPAVDANGTLIAHQAKPTTGNAQTATAGAGRTYVTEVLVDDLGHIAGVKTATEIDQDLAHNHDDQYKKIQTAVTDPTANGKSLTFIDTISQNAQGVIFATKKNVNLDDYALKSELPTADDYGVQSVTANDTADKKSGVKVDNTDPYNPKIEVDDTLTWIFDCGGAPV